MRLHDLSVTLDDGTVVVNEAEVVIAAGEKVLVVGETGTGKSTLVRAIAGLWPWGEGEVQVNSGSKLSLMPQRPYVPIGTLRRATTYPAAAEDIPRPEVAKALELAGTGVRYVSSSTQDSVMKPCRWLMPRSVKSHVEQKSCRPSRKRRRFCS